jgi:hypothetical protein
MIGIAASNFSDPISLNALGQFVWRPWLMEVLTHSGSSRLEILEDRRLLSAAGWRTPESLAHLVGMPNLFDFGWNIRDSHFAPHSKDGHGAPPAISDPQAPVAPVVPPVAAGPSAPAAPPDTSTPPPSAGRPAASPPPPAVILPLASAPLSPLPGNWTSVFDDEFNESALTGVWVPHEWWDTGATEGEGIEESAPYNVNVAGGSLKLTAKPDNTYGTGYTGALVQAGGIQGITTQSPAAFLYGYTEARIQIPPGQGLWPAFWLMPESTITTGVDHDANGEIDVMETLDGDPSTVYGTVHRNGAFQQSVLHTGINLSAGWHTFGVDWEPDHMTWYLDGQAYGTVTNASLIPNEAMYPIFDLAVGGSWGGPPNASTPFPATMNVDYVRTWQKVTTT